MKNVITAVIVTATAIGIWFAEYMLFPGYIIPFLNHPVARLFAIAGLVWLFIGFFCLLFAKKRWQISLLLMIFHVPFVLLPTLGPAIITIQGCTLGPPISNDTK